MINRILIALFILGLALAMGMLLHQPAFGMDEGERICQAFGGLKEVYSVTDTRNARVGTRMTSVVCKDNSFITRQTERVVK